MEFGSQARIDLLRQPHQDGGDSHNDMPELFPIGAPRAVIADETVYHCKSCDLHTVENGSRWVDGGPYLITELRIIAEARDRAAKADR